MIRTKRTSPEKTHDLADSAIPSFRKWKEPQQLCSSAPPLTPTQGNAFVNYLLLDILSTVKLKNNCSFLVTNRKNALSHSPVSHLSLTHYLLLLCVTRSIPRHVPASFQPRTELRRVSAISPAQIMRSRLPLFSLPFLTLHAVRRRQRSQKAIRSSHAIHLRQAIGHHRRRSLPFSLTAMVSLATQAISNRRMPHPSPISSHNGPATSSISLTLNLPINHRKHTTRLRTQLIRHRILAGRTLPPHLRPRHLRLGRTHLLASTRTSAATTQHPSRTLEMSR